jgi:hypothetical protein
MRHFGRVVMVSVIVSLFAGLAVAQQKQKPVEPANRIIPLKVGIVLSEYAGSKKISSLPYTLQANAVPANWGSGPQWTHLRLGVRVPIVTGAAPSSSGHAPVDTQIQYTDVGTNIDCSARALGDGSYQLDITTERSSLSLGSAGKEMEDMHVSHSQPIIRTFRVSNSIILRDGETDETTAATDPVSGHVMRISVTLHVVKSSS